VIASRREYTLALVTGAVGAGLIWLALREQWAQAVFTQPKPLPQQTVNVSGADLAPLAGALAIAALACLAAVIATRGRWRQAAGVILALLGAGAGAAVTTAVTAASVVSVAASRVGSPESAAVSGVAGSTTSGSSSTGSAVVDPGSTGHAIMTGMPWRYAVIAGALLIFAAGLATALRGQDWPVMSSRYQLPERQSAAEQGEQAGPGGEVPSAAPGARAEQEQRQRGQTPTAADGGDAVPAEAAARGSGDSASMWESLSGGEDPTS
jgi:uncharacterized membrane protein (TIGR02234 family)